MENGKGKTGKPNKSRRKKENQRERIRMENKERR